MLWVAAALGVLTATVPWVALIALIIVTFSGCWVMLAFRVGPPGPVFVVLVFGLAGVITGPDASAPDRARLTDPLQYLAVFSAGLLLAYVVSVFPFTTPRQVFQRAQTFRELLPGPAFVVAERTQLRRMCVAVFIAALVSVLWLDETRSYWTVATAVAVIGLNPQRRVVANRSVHRMVGALVGLVVYFVLAQWITEFWMLVVALVLLLNGSAAGSDISVIWQARVIDTVVGSLIGVLVSLWGWRVTRISLKNG